MKLHDLGFGNDLLAMIPKDQARKGRRVAGLLARASADSLARGRAGREPGRVLVWL